MELSNFEGTLLYFWELQTCYFRTIAYFSLLGSTWFLFRLKVKISSQFKVNLICMLTLWYKNIVSTAKNKILMYNVDVCVEVVTFCIK